jgi:hypothetical protein
MDEAMVSQLLTALRPLLGRTADEVEVWDNTAYQREYQQLSKRLSRLQQQKPKNKILVPGTFWKLIGLFSYDDDSIWLVADAENDLKQY